MDDYAHFFTSYVPDDIVTRNSAYEDMIERIRLATKGRVDEDSVDDELEAENTDFTFYSEGNYTFDPANLTKPSGIKNVAEMKEAITKGCAQKERANPLADNAALILKLEKEQKINALFMIALAKTETNCGRDGVGKSKKNIYSYGGGGQKEYKTYADGINAAIKGLSKNYLTPGGKYNGKPPRATTPHICQLETDRIYCASGCDSWIAGMLHTINRIGSSYSGNVNCSDVAVTGAQTTFANNKVSEMFRELWDILTGKNKEIDESKRKYGRHSNSISDLDIETMLMLTQAMMNRTAVSSQTDLYNLPFWEYGFNPFTDFQGYLNPYERPFDTSDLDIIGNFDEMGGVEVSRPYGSVVRAIDDSTVKSVGSTFVELALKDGKIVKFEGLMDISLQEGQEVSKGDVIGRVSKGSSVKIFMTSETGEKIDPSFILNPSAGDVGGKRGLIMQMATSLIGKPYVWGAKGPKSFDCSGFVYHVYKTAGITVPGSTVGQRTAGTQIKDIKQLLPGDMVHFNSAQSATGRHVGIFVGIDENGKPIMIHAGSKKTGVVRSDMSWWLKNGLFKYGVRVNELNE